MFVFGNIVCCIGGKSAVHKLVIIMIGFYK